MFYIKLFTIHNVQMHAGAIRNLLYGLCVCVGDNQQVKDRGLSSDGRIVLVLGYIVKHATYTYMYEGHFLCS